MHGCCTGRAQLPLLHPCQLLLKPTLIQPQPLQSSHLSMLLSESTSAAGAPSPPALPPLYPASSSIEPSRRPTETDRRPWVAEGSEKEPSSEPVLGPSPQGDQGAPGGVQRAENASWRCSRSWPDGGRFRLVCLGNRDGGAVGSEKGVREGWWG